MDRHQKQRRGTLIDINRHLEEELERMRKDLRAVRLETWEAAAKMLDAHSVLLHEHAQTASDADDWDEEKRLRFAAEVVKGLATATRDRAKSEAS